MVMEVVIEKKEEKKEKKRKVAWGITGSGDRLVETVEIMKQIKKQYQNEVDIIVYLSKAGDQVVKYYRLADDLKENFDRVWVEINPNSPFLAGQLQLGKFEFLLIAPATSNTVAKISMGIADSLLCNAAIMGLKAFVPFYIMPSDYEEGMIVTKLPNGRDMKLRIRKEDVEHVKKLAGMEDVFILEKPEEIHQVFKKRFNPEEGQ
ncbi:MAG: archaeoflavoprotein AfpA [Candidatus Bathyarchaeota archaeon]|nr:archaeoflavoprotein AfpA [Candidatus Bathyarchaeota archaeon]MDH5623067.1 archaeoflavoprotein AfpA [Candidatus Bathyarchaeota archaeon]MDH5635171.1 archaeoflavoprotein AfpA [Candidatus Bathyarchaeota archaeon]MDH5701325.1 archaeoflavoprotein AfpA [Candidatus Bathyarchaeota archaeon]